MPHLSLAQDFIKSGGLVLSAEQSKDGFANLKRLLQTFKRCFMEISEKMKREILYTMLQYLIQLNEQVIQKVENGQLLFEGTDILHVVTGELIPMLKDYYDSVRDQACSLLEYMITHFLRKSVVAAEERRDLLQMLRASSSTIGFSETMHAPTRQAAE